MYSFFKNHVFALFLTFALGLIATSCNTKDDEPVSYLFNDIASFVSSNDNGIVVTLRQENDSPLVTLTFPNQKINGEIKPGTRILIAYTTDSDRPYESGTGNLYGIGYVYNGELTSATRESTNSWQTMQQNLISLWRTGEWINIQTQCTYAQERPKKYDLVVDEATLDDDYPEIHLIYEADESVGADTKLFYASFNIGQVWDRPDVKGIKLTAMGNSSTQTYTFEKSE